MSERRHRTATTRSITVGPARLTWVPDGVVQLKPRGWFPDTTDRDWTAHDDLLDADGCLGASVGSVLVERDGRAVLIDAGYGPLDLPDTSGPVVGAARGGDLVRNLRSLGWDPHQIEAIAITHLHNDHIGWAHTLHGGAPAFPAARIVLSTTEWAHRADRLHQGVEQSMLDRMAPRVVTVADGAEVCPGIRALATPGHTPGHTSYVVDGGAERAIVIGDALHSRIQVTHPGWRSIPDTDPVASEVSRRRLVAALAEPGTTGVAGHFADEVFGRVTAAADGHPTWEPVA